MNILFGLTGSIACFKACDVISQLVKLGHNVQTVASPSTFQFIGKATLEGLTGTPVQTDLYAPGTMMDHIHLARWADVFVVCPATANTLNKFAAGIGDDLLSTLFLAYDLRRPLVMAPAMNSFMLEHPTTQASLQKLKAMGVEVLPTESGSLACGETGQGRLLNPDKIRERILSFEESRASVLREPNGYIATPLAGLSILVTAGGTIEPIDQVRYIANHSTGATGKVLAEHLSKLGADVTMLISEAASKGMELKHLKFATFDDLKGRLQELLSTFSFDCVIHAAAVSDYTVSQIVDEVNSTLSTNRTSKLESHGELTLRLKPNMKLIDHLRTWSKNKSIQIIGFKLTSSASPYGRLEAVRKMFSHAPCDYVVLNDQSEITDKRHPTTIYDQELNVVHIAETKIELASYLSSLILLYKDTKTFNKEAYHDLNP